MNKILIKKLRELTSAGMNDCKIALFESDNDFDRAVDFLKIKGLSTSAQNNEKISTEGSVVGTSITDKYSSMIEINCNTDFCANSNEFKKFCKFALEQLNIHIEEGIPFYHDSPAIEEARKELVSKTKENVVVRRWWIEQAGAENAKVFSYVHSNNKIGVLLTLLASSSEIANSAEFIALGNDLAMQVAAMSPLAPSPDRLDPEVVARQKTIFEAQLAELNKPKAAWDKILEGKMGKWFSDVCLLNQESVVAPKLTVEQVIKNLATKLGGEITVVNFIRAQVGEGIEQTKCDLAAEVAAMTGV